MNELRARTFVRDAGSVEGLTPIRNWDFDTEPHPCLDPAAGIFTVPRDGLYALRVEVSYVNKNPEVGRPQKARRFVDFCVRVCEPASVTQGTENVPEEELMDVGARSFAEVLHLRKDSTLTVLSSSTAGACSVLLTVDLVQRKRKRDPEPELTAKEMKKLQKKKRRLDRAAQSANSAVAKEKSPDVSLKEEVPNSDLMVDFTQPKRETVSLKVEASGGSKDGEESSDSGDVEWSAEFSSDSSDDGAAEDRGLSP